MSEELWLVGVGGAFLAFLILFSLVLVRSRESAGQRVLRESIERAEGKKLDKAETISLLRQAADVFEGFQKDEARKDRLQNRLEQAGWNLRGSEFRVLQTGLAVAGLVVGAGLLAHIGFGLILAAVGPVVAELALTRKVGKRSSAFEEQLPDVLQLLAGSLRAGYGFLQAIDTAATEASEPAASEFARVVTEARLGGSVEVALEAMAERLDSPDFRWVVIAVNIQRQVGGNLAELLETVAETVRERERLRRHVKALSAEGRLSAVILFALPIFVAGYIMIVNPDYMAVLYESTVGLIALGLMTLFMGLGVVWIRKIIRIVV
jgi:tight adherence protein B